MKVQVTKELIESYQSAHALSDDDVKALLAYFSGVRLALMPCPPEYQLFLNDVRVKCDRLQDMLDARAEMRRRGSNWARQYGAGKSKGSAVNCSV